MFWPISLPPSARWSVGGLKNAFKVAASTQISHHFSLFAILLESSLHLHTCPTSHGYVENLFQPFNTSFISNISQSHFWLVCHLPQLGLQPQTSKTACFLCPFPNQSATFSQQGHGFSASTPYQIHSTSSGRKAAGFYFQLHAGITSFSQLSWSGGEGWEEW